VSAGAKKKTGLGFELRPPESVVEEDKRLSRAAARQDQETALLAPHELSGPLSARELTTLETCEKVMEKARTSIRYWQFEVGRCLARIQLGKLYRQHWSSFEDYCLTRWDLTRPRVYQLIDFWTVSTNVATRGLPKPLSEAQTRALAPLRHEPEKLLQIWAKAVGESEGGQPTARLVAELVEGVRPPGKRLRRTAVRVVAARDEEDEEQEEAIQAHGGHLLGLVEELSRLLDEERDKLLHWDQIEALLDRLRMALA
jgi:hypothetical protein